MPTIQVVPQEFEARERRKERQGEAFKGAMDSIAGGILKADELKREKLESENLAREREFAQGKINAQRQVKGLTASHARGAKAIYLQPAGPERDALLKENDDIYVDGVNSNPDILKYLNPISSEDASANSLKTVKQVRTSGGPASPASKRDFKNREIQANREKLLEGTVAPGSRDYNNLEFGSGKPVGFAQGLLSKNKRQNSLDSKISGTAIDYSAKDLASMLKSVGTDVAAQKTIRDMLTKKLTGKETSLGGGGSGDNSPGILSQLGTGVSNLIRGGPLVAPTSLGVNDVGSDGAQGYMPNANITTSGNNNSQTMKATQKSITKTANTSGVISDFYKTAKAPHMDPYTGLLDVPSSVGQAAWEAGDFVKAKELLRQFGQ